MFTVVQETLDAVNGVEYSYAAEVGLLTRNIRITGESTEDFGARVLVGVWQQGTVIHQGDYIVTLPTPQTALV